MKRLGESLTMYLTRSMAGSERRPVASTRKMARCWGSSTRSPTRIGRYRARLAASRTERTLESPGMERGSPWGSRMPRREYVEAAGFIAAGDVDVPPVGCGDDEPAVGARELVVQSCGRRRGLCGSLARIAGGRSEWRCVVGGGLVPERGETGVSPVFYSQEVFNLGPLFRA
jgi:hypothetical protein